MKKGALYTIGSIVILIICFVAFVLPSTFGSAANKSEQVYGKYNGRKIVYEQGSDFQQYVSYYADMIRNQGFQIDDSTQNYIFSYAFNSTVTKYAYDDFVKKSGYSVPKTAINRQLRQNFLDENGVFSQRLFRETDSKTVEAIRDEIEDNFYSGRFYNDVFGSETEILGETNLYGLKTSSKEAAFLEDYGRTRAAFNMAAFNKSDFPEEEKLKYARENSAKFNKFDMSIISVTEKNDADRLAKRIANEEITFEDAITESNKSYSNTEGKLTVNYQYQVENILSDKADLAKLADMKKGDISPVIQTSTGYSIFRADDVLKAADFDDEDTKSRVSTYVLYYESGVVEDYYTARATDFSTAVRQSDFDKACEDFGITKTEIPAFPLNYGSATITQSVNTSLAGLSGADTNESFLKTAFSLSQNELSEPIVTGNYVVVLQRTGTETAEPQENAAEAISAELKDYDQTAGQNAIFNSPKLENNFSAVYN